MRLWIRFQGYLNTRCALLDCPRRPNVRADSLVQKSGIKCRFEVCAYLQRSHIDDGAKRHSNFRHFKLKYYSCVKA